MGTSYSVYLGPYLRCPNRTVDKKLTVEGCPQCRHDHTNNFCARCATPKGTFMKIIEAPEVSLNGIDIHNRLWHIPLDLIDLRNEYFTPNIPIEGIKRKRRYDPRYERCAVPLPIEDQQKEVQLFRETFEKEIELLRAHFDIVSEEWGLLVWQF